MKNVVNTVASSVGKGLVAGFVGTAAMTVSSSLEARIRGRAASSAPARATAKVLGIREFEDDIAAARFNDLSHWGYGTMWGVVRARRRDLGQRRGHAPRARGRPAVRLLGPQGGRHRHLAPRRLHARDRPGLPPHRRLTLPHSSDDESPARGGSRRVC